MCAFGGARLIVSVSKPGLHGLTVRDRLCRPMLPAGQRLFARLRKQSFPLGLLPRGLLGPADSFRLLAYLPLGRLLESAAKLHLAEYAFALQLLLQDPHGLFDIVFTDEDLQRDLLFKVSRYGEQAARRDESSFGCSNAASWSAKAPLSAAVPIGASVLPSFSGDAITERLCWCGGVRRTKPSYKAVSALAVWANRSRVLIEPFRTRKTAFQVLNGRLSVAVWGRDRFTRDI